VLRGLSGGGGEVRVRGEEASRRRVVAVAQPRPLESGRKANHGGESHRRFLDTAAELDGRAESALGTEELGDGGAFLGGMNPEPAGAKCFSSGSLWWILRGLPFFMDAG
jgi:hypothetical protein